MAESLIEEKIEKAKNKHKNSFYEVDDKDDKQRFFDVNNKAKEALFDNTHDTNKINKTINEIEQTKKYKTETNPFFVEQKSFNALSKNYKEVVTKPKEQPTLEIKEEIMPQVVAKEQTKTKSHRKKLWIAVTAICVVLFFGVFGYNMISINSLAKRTITTQHQISEIEKTIESSNQNYEDLINSSTVFQEMTEADSSVGQQIDLSPKNTQQKYETKTSLWNRLCNFIAGIFGR